MASSPSTSLPSNPKSPPSCTANSHDTNQLYRCDRQPVKRFTPLENNPDVMNKIIHELGVSKELCFSDVLSIDDPDLLGFIPRPSYALLLVFPIDAVTARRHSSSPSVANAEAICNSEPILWFPQTISNACGLYAVLHAVTNGPARQFVDPNSPLGKIMAQSYNIEPMKRAKLIEQSEFLEQIHQSAAVMGDTSAPSSDDNIDLHFVTFIKTDDNKIWELDGQNDGPILRGKIEPTSPRHMANSVNSTDMLCPEALSATIRKFINFARQNEPNESDNYSPSGTSNGPHGDLRFSIISLGPNFDYQHPDIS